MDWFFPFFYMEAKLRPLEKGYLTTDIYMKIFSKQPGTPFLATKGMKKYLKS